MLVLDRILLTEKTQARSFNMAGLRHQKERIATMITTSKRFAGILFPALVLVFSSADAMAATPVTTCGQILSSPGNYYLPASLTCPSTSGILVTANNVNIDLNGNTLNGSGGGNHGIITSKDNNPPPGDCTGVRGLHITNGTITGFVNTGVFLCADSPTNMGGHVDHMNITGNSIAMVLANSNNNQIEDNNLSQSVPAYGLLLVASNDNEITGNLIYGNTVGIYMNFGYSNNNNIHANVVANSAGVGIQVQQGNNNRIAENVVSGPSYGIVLGPGTAGETISGNTAFNNTPFDLYDENFTCSMNTWRGNLFAAAYPACIH
jgi:parallel beta-helix repeat protein